uniref:Secreted protein n=1 Tax=Parascaris univalens TaxID=6257 RepID=A0A915A6B9_PARUN
FMKKCRKQLLAAINFSHRVPSICLTIFLINETVSSDNGQVPAFRLQVFFKLFHSSLCALCLNNKLIHDDCFIYAKFQLPQEVVTLLKACFSLFTSSRPAGSLM